MFPSGGVKSRGFLGCCGYLFVGVKAVTYFMQCSGYGGFKGSQWPTRIHLYLSLGADFPRCRCPFSATSAPGSLHMHFNFPVVGNCRPVPLGHHAAFVPAERAMISCQPFLPVVIAFGRRGPGGPPLHYSTGKGGPRRGNVPARHMLAL